MQLTLERLKEMKPGMFATGLAIDSPDDINIERTGRELRWVAVRGDIHDWGIYILFSTFTSEEVKRMGHKVCCENHIQKLVPCDDEAFKMYRY